MTATSGPARSSDVHADSDAILERARTGTRLMTMRGAAMRFISVGANLLLLVLVSPSELGLLAVARGTFTLLQYVAELGIGKALVRRAQAPSAREYAALAGLQLLVGSVIVIVGFYWSRPILGFGSLDQRWHLPMLGTVATMLSLAFGTGARVRLERALAYERLAMVDVFNVLALNVGLVIFALMHQFSIGVFVILGVATVSANALLYAWAPGPVPSLDLRPLTGIARQSSGFLVASTLQIMREQGTPVLVGSLFGLPVAGLYSFAERVAQVLNITFDGFRNASIPAAARLAHDWRSLRALSTRTLAGSLSLTAPAAIIAVCALPVLAAAIPRWSGAIALTQWYVIAYAIFGVLVASMEPAAVAVRGAQAAVAEQGWALLAGWLTFAAVRPLGVGYLPLAVAAMYVAPVLALHLVTTDDIRPEVTREVMQTVAAFAACLSLYVMMRMLSAPLLLTAAVPPLVILAAVPRFRRMPRQLVEFWYRRRQRA